jgi:hypothetical protein
MGERPKGTSLDRINNDEGYCKENCRWATSYQQIVNRTITRYITFNGETLLIQEWASRLNINVKTVRTRLHRGWTVERALS